MSTSKVTHTEFGDGQSGPDLVQACVRYGFCAPVCPTYDVLRTENDGPRGRIALIKEMYASGAAPLPSTVFHLDRCLSCAACMSTCAAGVNYRRIIDEARAHVERTHARPLQQRFTRAIITFGLTRPRLSRALLALNRLFPVALIPWAPASLRPFLAFAQNLPKTRRYGDAAVASHDTHGTGSRIFLLEGCVQQVLAPRNNDAAVRLFNRNGCHVTRSVSANCCGALALHMGRPDLARRQAAKVLDEIEHDWHEGYSAVMATASGCSAVLKEYGELFQGTPREALAAKVSAIAKDPVQALKLLSHPLEAKRNARFAVAVHEPCSLRFVHKLSGGYEEALKSVGLRPFAVPEGHMCCGSAGSYSITEPQISEQLGRRRATQIEALNTPVVITGNIGCLMQLGRYLKRWPLHAIEVLDWVNGGPQPPELDGWEDWPSAIAKSDENPATAIW